MKSCRVAFLRAHKLFKTTTFLITFVSYLLLPTSIIANSPASTNYILNEWSVGGGDQGLSTNSQTQLSLEPVSGGDAAESTNYGINPGLLFVEMANVPPAPSITNPAEYYNKLHFIIDQGDNPSDATYAVAISTNGFVNTYYVKADNTIGTTLTATDWRDYASWGGATGIDIIGLVPNTTYSVKVKAEQGLFTETPWGPSASAQTDIPKLSFDIDVAATDTETASPYVVDFGQLTVDTVTTATDKIWTDFTTNAVGGGVVYIAGDNDGLLSSATSHTIAGVSSDLSAEAEGFGLITNSITESSGGPYTADSPFDGSGDTVGSTGTTLIPLATSLAPIWDGRQSLDVKTIISQLTPAASDYTETLTLVAAGTF